MGVFDEWLRGGDKPKPDPRKLSMDSIKWVDRYDREDLRRIAAEMREFRVKRDKLCDTAPDTGGHLTSDTFFDFLKVEPELLDPSRMRPSFLINRAVQEELQNSTEFERLHGWTEGDIVASAMAFVSMEEDLETLYDKVKHYQQEAQDIENAIIELMASEQGERDIDEMIRAWKESNDLTPEEWEEVEKQRKRIEQAIAELRKRLQEQGEDLENKVDTGVRGCMPGIRQDMNEAADDAEEMATAAGGFGLDPGELKRMDAKQRLALAERINGNPKFKKLAELIGPMQRIAMTEQTRKVNHANEEVYDIESGNDLSRMLPASFMGIKDNKFLKLDFYRKFLERKHLQYAMRGTEKVGKGAIIFCMDNSGSMMGDPEIWAKGTGLACLSIAREQKRAFTGLHFGSRRELMRFDFPTPESITFDKVIDYAEFFYGGGTDFVRPLSEALKILQAEEKAKGHVEGDIVFVTDGYCSVPDQWLKDFKAEQDRLQFKVYGILIADASQREQDPLWTICDHQVVTVSDLLSAEPVREMFRDL